MPSYGYNRKGVGRFIGKAFKKGISSLRNGGVAYRRFISGMKYNPYATISRFGRKVVGSAARAARSPLGVAAAVYSARRSVSSAPAARRRMRRRRRYGVSGPKIKTRRPKDIFGRFNRDGIVFNDEEYNVAVDAKCIYVETAIVRPIHLVHVLVKALLRKLFEKANITINSVTEILSLQSFHTSGGAGFGRVILSSYNSGTGAGYSNKPVDINASWTLQTISEQFYQDFMNYSTGFDNNGILGNALNVYKPMTFTLQIDGAVVSQIDVTGAQIEVMARNVFKIQNSTEAYRPAGVEEENDEDADNVGAVPLQGKIYKFNSLPRTKLRNAGDSVRDNNQFGEFPTNKLLKTIGGTGMSLELGEPMGPGFFWNCRESANFKIQPGEIRTFTMYHKTKFVNLLDFLKKIRVQQATEPLDFAVTHFPMPVCLIGLEEMIQSNSLNPIKIRYEAESKLGMRVRFKKAAYCRTQVLTSTVTP